MTRYPSGLVEVLVYEKRVGGPRKPPKRTGGPMREDSVQRARSNVRRRLMALDARFLLTLTTRENLTDFETSRRQVEKFIRKLRRAYPGLHYCGCPERQKRGAWHWHLGVAVRLDAVLVRQLWRECCGDGNIDLRHRTALHIARYVAKYIGKDIDGSQGGATYIASRGIPEPETQEYNLDEPTQAFSAIAEQCPEWTGEIFELPAGRGWWSGGWR